MEAVEACPARTKCNPPLLLLFCCCRSVFDLPLELKDKKTTALRISLPPHFPQVGAAAAAAAAAAVAPSSSSAQQQLALSITADLSLQTPGDNTAACGTCI
jgi:hypothetical protein